VPSTSDRELLREAIRRTLVRQLENLPGQKSVGAAAVATWRQVSERLVPVIGRQGVDVLFGRAVHLTSVAYPWLDGGAGSPGSLPDFRARLEASDRSAASDASQAVLVNFIELLGSLIGAPLTERLLAPVWAAHPLTNGLEKEA
jgi:hypothetical protein